MINVYFQIFGTKLRKKLTEKEYQNMTDEQIEYFVRGELKIDGIVRDNIEAQDGVIDQLKDIFGFK